MIVILLRSPLESDRKTICGGVFGAIYSVSVTHTLVALGLLAYILPSIFFLKINLRGWHFYTSFHLRSVRRRNDSWMCRMFDSARTQRKQTGGNCHRSTSESASLRYWQDDTLTGISALWGIMPPVCGLWSYTPTRGPGQKKKSRANNKWNPRRGHSSQHLKFHLHKEKQTHLKLQLVACWVFINQSALRGEAVRRGPAPTNSVINLQQDVSFAEMQSGQTPLSLHLRINSCWGTTITMRGRCVISAAVIMEWRGGTQ